VASLAVFVASECARNRLNRRVHEKRTRYNVKLENKDERKHCKARARTPESKRRLLFDPKSKRIA
jgi:hypothetical protein